MGTSGRVNGGLEGVCVVAGVVMVVVPMGRGEGGGRGNLVLVSGAPVVLSIAAEGDRVPQGTVAHRHMAAVLFVQRCVIRFQDLSKGRCGDDDERRWRS